MARGGLQSSRVIQSPLVKIFLLISAIRETHYSMLLGPPSVAFAFFSKEVSGVQRLDDGTFDDLL